MSSIQPSPGLRGAGGRGRPSSIFRFMLFVLLLQYLVMVIDAAPFACSTPHALSTQPGPNALCQCADGWFGPTCEICMNDDVCGLVLKTDKSDAVCRNTTYTAIHELNGWCEISSQDVSNLIHGTGFVQIYYNKNATFFFDFIKRRGDGGFLSLFRCNSKTTTVQLDPKLGEVRYASPDLVCTMTCSIGSDRTCTQGLDGIVKQVGAKGGSTIVCNPKLASCDVHEYTLDTFLGGVKTAGCHLSECALRGEESDVSMGSFAAIFSLPPEQQTSYILGMTLLTCTLAILAIALSYHLRSFKFSNFEKATQYVFGPTALSKGGSSTNTIPIVVGGAGVMSTPSPSPTKTYPIVCDNLHYAVGSKKILKGVFGVALPGELLAIMGPSGSGKTTMIDILAMKAKRGSLYGTLLYDGHTGDEETREAIGFVDQEDNLMGTLTVYEAVLFSAFLRLPDAITMREKATRVMQVLADLRIQHIADSFIGIKGRRGISGGEKRRVVVACELVKVPSILFLDEPTSGLDSFNAALLVDCMRDLAARNQTNVVMTIHQPRSNVYTSFDKNLVLNQGEVIYYGKTNDVPAYFASIGHEIPEGYNPADFLIDVLFLQCTCEDYPTVTTKCLGGGEEEKEEVEEEGEVDSKATPEKRRKKKGGGNQEIELVHQRTSPGLVEAQEREREQQSHSQSHSQGQQSNSISSSQAQPEQASSLSQQQQQQKEEEDQQLQESRLQIGSPLRLAPSSPPRIVRLDILEAKSPSRSRRTNDKNSATNGSAAGGLREGSSLVPWQDSNPFAKAFRESEYFKAFSLQLGGLLGTQQSQTEGGEASSNVERKTTPSSLSKGPLPFLRMVAKSVHRWCWEVGVLSRRSLLDLVRNPMLFLSHATAASYFAVVLGAIYYNLSMRNLQAVQNRLGAFLLSSAFLIFTSVSALPLFWLERNLYLHEQSNRFYTASAYFVCKIVFDLIPLRVLPTIIYGAVTYGMIGLRPGFQHFIIYEAFLILLVTTSAVLNLIIGMVTRNIMSGILIATIIMIHFLMLTNLFINFDSMNIKWLKFLKRISFMNYSYEGMAQNELVGRRLEDFEIKTGQGVLVKLGFSTTSMYYDMMSLHIYLIVSIALAFIVLKLCVRELR